jgi:WD40 repeat protein
LWDSTTGEQLSKEPLPHDGAVGHVEFSRDGKLILTTVEGTGKNVYLWDAVTGVRRNPLEHETVVNHATFSSDSRYVAVALGSRDDNASRAAVIWDIAARSQVTKFPLESKVDRVAFSPNGRHLFTSSDTITVWDIESKTPIAVIPDNGIFAISPALNDDGSRTVAVADAFDNQTDLHLDLDRSLVSLWPYFEKTEDLVAAAKRTMARCLMQEERSAFKLDAAPPRWCITGAGRERADRAKWVGTWPYDTEGWRNWLAARAN